MCTIWVKRVSPLQEEQGKSLLNQEFKGTTKVISNFQISFKMVDLSCTENIFRRKTADV